MKYSVFGAAVIASALVGSNADAQGYMTTYDVYNGNSVNSAVFAQFSQWGGTWLEVDLVDSNYKQMAQLLEDLNTLAAVGINQQVVVNYSGYGANGSYHIIQLQTINYGQ